MSARDSVISLHGMDQTRKGVQEFGRGWLFISFMKVRKSRSLLMLAYKKSNTNRLTMISRRI